MRIALGADHAGFILKEYIKDRIPSLGHEVIDMGTHSVESVDYPDYALAVCTAINEKQADLGILFCGAGIGMNISANKRHGIRAATCSECYSAHICREHNNANVLCLGERVTGVELAWEIAKSFLESTYSSEERHQRRVDKITALEQY
ncbi:MAG: ribose 5-phosphate isomerase B [bacterium]